MPIYKVKKRNWSIVSFDKSKINEAITQAIKAVGGSDFEKVEYMTNLAIKVIENKIWTNIPNIEDIQDAVEDILIKEWHNEVAKAYIVYRTKRKESRQDRKVVIEVGNTMNEYLDKADWRVNSNANIWYSIGWLILNSSWKITANYWLSHVYPDEVGNAHRNWDYHIHDLDMFTWYCAGWSLRALLEEWFNWVPNKVESAPPRNLQSAVNQMVNFFWTTQNEWAWAQAFSSFDTYLAPYVHKFKEELIADLDSTNPSFKSEEAREEYIYDRVYKYT